MQWRYYYIQRVDEITNSAVTTTYVQFGRRFVETVRQLLWLKPNQYIDVDTNGDIWEFKKSGNNIMDDIHVLHKHIT